MADLPDVTPENAGEDLEALRREKKLNLVDEYITIHDILTALQDAYGTTPTIDRGFDALNQIFCETVRAI